MMYQTYENELEAIFDERRAAVPPTIKDVMESLKGKQIVFYGAGAFGIENLHLFQKYGVTPAAFLDRSAKPGGSKSSIPIYHPDDPNLSESFRKNCMVYICITVPKRIMSGIKTDLRNWGYIHCQEVQTITAMQVGFEGSLTENPSVDYLFANKEKIQNALALMGDEESCKTYLSSIRAHFLRNYSSCFETDFPMQYFDPGVALKKGLSCFVDCGAYNGDSLRQALGFCCKMDMYIAFEPVTDNFLSLAQEVEKVSNQVGHAYLFPCGAADKTGNARFTISASSSALTEGSAGEILPLVRLDDVLKQIPVTFLKMDIEGAEMTALRGAKELISRYMPDLAISVYHAANHFWDIPCLIAEINPNYKFFLRAHTPATLESVLYCSI